MTILLLLALTAQLWPPSSPIPLTGPTPAETQAARRADLEFTDAVENFVRAAEPTAVPPEPFRSLIAGLGAECYTCRELAGRRLAGKISASGGVGVTAARRDSFGARRDPDAEIPRKSAVQLPGPAIRWLLWARHDRDPEIRLRCNNLLRDLTRCEQCGGTGFCREFRTGDPNQNGPCQNCGHWGWEHPECRAECWACGGDGSGWRKGAFD